MTGDEPATGAQISYLETLARQVGRDVPERLSKADASRLIDELKAGTSQRPLLGSDGDGFDGGPLPLRTPAPRNG